MSQLLKGLVLMLALSASGAHAGKPLFILKGSAEFGGDELYEAHFTSGDVETTRAGDGNQIAIGAAFKHSGNWQSEATIGYRFGGSIGENGTLDFNSVPYELLSFYRSGTGKWRAGGGLSYVTNMNMESGGIIEGLEVEFEDALGAILEVDWFLGLRDKIRFERRGHAYFGLRATVIDYEIEGIKRKFDGNSFGLILGLGF